MVCVLPEGHTIYDDEWYHLHIYLYEKFVASLGFLDAVYIGYRGFGFAFFNTLHSLGVGTVQLVV